MPNLIRSLGRRLRDHDIGPLDFLEARLLRARSGVEELPIQLPLIAIVGPPRAGSTLIYQLLAATFAVSHLDNIQHAFLRYPYLGYCVSRVLCRRRQYRYESDHGFVEGLGGLSEGNFFWPFWFDMQMEQKTPHPDPHRLKHVARFFNLMFEIERCPMVASFNAHSFYLVELESWFTKVLFVNLTRNRAANAVSLLRARKRLTTDVRSWWSHKPARCRTSENTDPYRQIACQITATREAISEARSKLSPEIFLDVEYERLCGNPARALEQFEAACRRAGIDIEARSSRAVPHLEARGPAPEESEDFEKFSQLFGG